MPQPDFLGALQQRNMQTPGGVVESALPETGGGVSGFAGIQTQNPSVPNFALALEQGMPNIGVMADTPTQFMDPGRLGLGQIFQRRLGKGVDQTQQLGGALFRMLGRESGSASMETFGQNIIDGNQEEMELYAPMVESLGEIENFDDFLEWGVGGFAGAIPSLATAMAGGGIGGAIGKSVVKRKIKNEMTDRMLTQLSVNGFARDAAEGAAARTMRNPATAKILKDALRYGNAVDMRRGAMRGASLGMFIPSSGMMTGEAELAGVKDPLLALGAGITGGLLETAVMGRALRMFFPGVDAQVSKNFVKDFAKATLSQSALEGSQEGAQQLIQMAALAYHDPSFDFLDPDNAMQVIDSFAIGALVGTVMGAGGSAVGEVSARARGIRGSADTGGGTIDPFETPDIGPPGGPDNGLPPDFEPADNTMTEEITGRVNNIMRAHVTPAMNIIQEQVSKAVKGIADAMPGARTLFEGAVNPVRKVNDEFIAGTLPVIEEVRRYAGEQVAYIVEAAEEITDPKQRQDFIESELAQVEEEIAGVAEDIASRGEQLAERASERVANMDFDDLSTLFEDKLSLGSNADPEFTFGKPESIKTQQGVSFSRHTRGDRAVPIKTRKSAENQLKELRKIYPSANESSFQIEAVDGGYVITLADQLQRDVLLEDEVVSRGVTNARTSARGSPDADRQVKLENKTTIDVPTLAFAGRKLDRGDQQSLAEAFAAITGRLLDRGTITDADFVKLQAVFESHFNRDTQLSNVRQIAEREAAIERGDFEPTGPKQVNPTPEQDEAAVERERQREARKRFDAMEVDERRTVTRGINQVIDDAGIEGYQRAEWFNTLLPAAMDQLDANPNQLFNLGTAEARAEVEQGTFELFDPKEDAAKGPDGTDRSHVRSKRFLDTDPNVDDTAFPATETEQEQADRSRDTRNPNQRSLPQQGGETVPKTDEIRYLMAQQEVWAEDLAQLEEAVADQPVGAQNQTVEMAELRQEIADADERIDVLRKELRRSNTKKKKDDPSQETPRETVKRRQKARLKKEGKRDRAAKKRRGDPETNRKKRTKKKKPVTRKPKRAKPTLRTPHEKVATRRPKKAPKDRAVVWFPGVKGRAKLEEASKELVDRVLQLLPESKTELRVLNKDGLRQMMLRNHPDSDMAALLIESPIAAIISSPGRPTYIMVPDSSAFETIRGDEDSFDAGIFLNTLSHELGHHIHFETWETMSREGQDAILQAFRRDVASGKFTPAEGRGKINNIESMPDNAHEFREWMADQFVDWMMNRRQPRNALGRFMEKVAKRVQAFWDFIGLQPGRYGMLNETYADFVDTLAKRMTDGNVGNDFWFKEGSVSRGMEILFGPPGEPVQMNLPPMEVERLRRSLEEYPRIATNANKMIEWMKAAWWTAIAPSTSKMRDLSKKGIRAADELVRMFNRQPLGQSKVGRVIQQNYHQAREQMQGVFMTRISKILSGASEAELFRLGQEMRAMDGNADMVPTTLRGRQLRKLLDEMHIYAREAGLPVGKIDNYFPRVFNREELIADEQEIIRYLTGVYRGQMSARQRAEDPNFAVDQARKTYNSLISQEADALAAMRELAEDPLATQTPAGGFMRSRTATDKFFGKYYNNNVEAVMANYVNTVTKRAEYNRLLGQKAFPQQTGGDSLNRSQWDPKKKLKDILRDAREQGATDDELKYMKNYVEANIGMYGRDSIPEGARKVLATVVAYQNMRTLLFSVFASLPDAMGPAIRSGSTKEAFRSLFKNIADIRRNDGNAADMARTWGIISDAYNQHVLTEYVDNHYMPKGIRRWNDAFFKYTGLNWWTDFTRKAALAVGVDSIRNEALKSQTAPTQRERDRATQFLGELGLTSSEVNSWVSRGQPTWGSMAYTETNEDNIRADRAVANSLVQFVDESILRPNPSQRPILASHPALMLVYHLKGFMYAIHDTIIKRLIHNFNIAKTPAQIAAVFTPAVGMMLMTAIGLELREVVTGTDYTDRMEGWDYTWEVFERTGLPGITQYAWDWDSASARGQSELAGVGGPALSQFGDLLSKPSSQTIPKAIPVVSQLPWARDFLRGG